MSDYASELELDIAVPRNHRKKNNTSTLPQRKESAGQDLVTDCGHPEMN